jgi:predicted dehydrogenase
MSSSTLHTPATPLRFAVIGAGFWANYQLAAWQELAGAKCVAICDRDRAKAQALADRFNVPTVHDDANLMFGRESLDFVDIITDVHSHVPLVKLAAKHRVPAICQKPLAMSYAAAAELVETCRAAGVPLFVHENWRWQTPIRQFKHALDEGAAGKPFRARIDMISGFPVFKNQPALAELEQFILTDMGVHIFDVARFLFGEAQSLYATTHRVHKHIKGEDVATVVLKMGATGPASEGVTVICNMAYAENHLERECFPETQIFVEADRGSAELAPGHWIRVTTADGTLARRYPPPEYGWVNAAYAVAQSALVACNANLLAGIRTPATAETTAQDNLKTLRLVFDAYESSRENRVVHYR